MLTDQNSVHAAWTAFLTLAGPEQRSFLTHAGAYRASMEAAELAHQSIPNLMPIEPAHLRAPTLLPGGFPGPARAAETGSGHQERRATIAPELSVFPSLPLIGGPDLDLEPRSAFCQPALTRAWRPGPLVGVYIAGSPGLKQLMRGLQMHAYAVGVDDFELEARKVGISADVAGRMVRLGRERHGSVCKADLAGLQPGFDLWTAEALPTATLDPSPGSPVRVLGDRLEVTLPAGVTPSAFDQTLARALAGATLAGWAMSGAGQAYCAARDIDPLNLVRGTPGAKGRVTWASEIVLIRPRPGAARLLRVCEDLVIGMVMAERSTAAPVRATRPRKRS